jgi:hypothetical protein
MVDSGSKWLFVINDIFADSGNDMNSQNLVKRLNRCYEICDRQFVQDEQDVCDIQIKRYFHYHDFTDMVGRFRESLPYSCRGIYFKPLFLKFKDILYNFDDTLVKKVIKKKYKGESAFLGADNLAGLEGTVSSSDEVESNATSVEVEGETEGTIMSPPHQHMYLQKTNQPDIYEVFDAASVSKGVACVNNIKVSKMLKLEFDAATPIDKKRFMCHYHAKFGKWSPVERA